MTYIYRLAGENLELAEAELKGFLKSQGIEEKPERKERIAKTQKHPEQLKRLALVHEVSKKIAEIELDELKKSEISYEVEQSFAVKSEVLEGDKNPEKIEETLGEKIAGENNAVDLENPETVINAYVQKGKITIGKQVQDIPRGLYQERTNEKRPYSSPISLDPVLARVLINLSETPPGGKILDPFCGTGGILIEAGLCGIMPLGTDIQKEMVNGTQKNLEEYGITNHKIRKQKAENSLNQLKNVSAIVTDLPYGKASKKQERTEEKFLELIDNFKGKTVFMYNQPELGTHEANFEVYQHKNLTRYIYSC